MKSLYNKDTRLSSDAELREQLNAEMAEWQNAAQAFDEAVAERLGLNLTDLRCLSMLHFRGSMAPSELSSAAGLTSGAMTAAIDRWERAGYARRTRDEADRRRIDVALTDKFRKVAAEVWGPMAEKSQKNLLGYPKKDLILLIGFVQKSRALQEMEAQRLRQKI